jgi:hypothetical protein
VSAPFIDNRIARAIQQHERKYHMPMVNNSQARVELSAAQAEAFTELVMGSEGSPELPPMIYIEETNLGNTVVVGGRGMPMTLIHHNGTIHKMGGTDGD